MKKLKVLPLALLLFLSLLLTACPSQDTPKPSGEAVWDEASWDSGRWQ